ncbi:ABC transporter substrate-binding protein [Streptomyces tateyamensis]|uniref:ABC transporter substrate-binding protein n=1 Tax=Streptomyces tateyamensis TaxID=565073 RepID=A0A2V4PIN2_9ACTN|nr:extracellular solute-binding protein [Streptomyces tateyamensis]PYC85419.1 ABC transporter substrate-binding protein [Streptomyces tateyamensis]
MKSRLSAALASSALLLSGCGVLGIGSDGPVTLKLVAADYGDNPTNSSQHYWDDLARRFQADHPKIRIDVQVINWTDIDKRVAEMVKNGHTPDLVQTGGYADQVAADRLYEASEVLSMDTEANLLDAFSRAGQVMGTQYGIPFVSSSRTFFYNKAIFAKAGIAQPPATWSELKADAALIKAKVPGVIPYGLPLGPEEAQAESMMWTMSGGGGLTDDAGLYTLDSQANEDTFGWLKANLVDTRLTYPDPGTVGRATAFDDFAKGRVAMLNGHPALVQKATGGHIDYGTAQIPRKDPQAKNRTLGVADWMLAFKANNHRSQIREFLNFAYTKENTLAFDEQYNLLPVTQDTLEDMTNSGKHPDLKPFLDALPAANFYPLGDPAWDTVSGKVKTDIGKAVTSDPAPVLGELQQFAEDASKRQRGL